MDSSLSRRDAIRLLTSSAAVLTAAASYGRQPGGKAPPTSPGDAGPKPGVLTRAIPSTSEKVPVVGLGTWQVFDVDPTPEKLGPLE